MPEFIVCLHGCKLLSFEWSVDAQSIHIPCRHGVRIDETVVRDVTIEVQHRTIDRAIIYMKGSSIGFHRQQNW